MSGIPQALRKSYLLLAVVPETFFECFQCLQTDSRDQPYFSISMYMLLPQLVESFLYSVNAKELDFDVSRK